MLSRMTADQLRKLAESIRAGEAKGVIYSLADVNSALLQKEPTRLEVRKLAETILEQVEASSDGLTTYGELWVAMTGQDWRGNSPRSHMSKALRKLIAYCHLNRLPIITTLVVTKAQRRLTDQAVKETCEECANLGIPTGADKRRFVEEEAKRSRLLRVGNLPKMRM